MRTATFMRHRASLRGDFFVPVRGHDPKADVAFFGGWRHTFPSYRLKL
jgi:hypothetical protein